MAEILTSNFKTDTTRRFVDDLLSNDVYLFASKVERVDGVNSRRSKMDFLEKTLFGKKVATDDIKYMIRYFPWQPGQVYIEYDDTVDLEDRNFYAVVGPNYNNSGDYQVFICIDNDDNSTVINPPSYNGNTFYQEDISDGYIWRYMYSMSSIEFEAYNALGYVPIVGDFDTDPSFSANNAGSPIVNIKVENPQENNGYEEVEGSVVAKADDNDVQISFPLSTSFSKITDYYVDQSVLFTNVSSPSSEGYLYRISNYVFNDSTNIATLTLVGSVSPEANGIDTNFNVKILPRVEINGDGTGASGYPLIENGSITRIIMKDYGSGYNNATARIVDPEYDFYPDDPATIDSRASVRPILAPPGDFGYNLIDDFRCHHFLIYAYITGEDNNQIGSTNKYSASGIVKNPEFLSGNSEIFDNRIAITTNDYDSANVNSIVTQSVSGVVTFSALVHEVDASSNTIYLSDYMGPYQGYDANTSISLDPDLPLVNQSGQLILINTPTEENIVYSNYIQRTGKVYFMEDYIPVDRDELSREEFKFVMEF